MTVDEWIRSVNLSFKIRKNPYNGRDIRADLLRGCEIRGECWVSGVSAIRLGPRILAPRQLAYAVFRGPIPRGTADKVATTCGNPQCCFPGHLMLVANDVKRSPDRTKSKGCDEPPHAN